MFALAFGMLVGSILGWLLFPIELADLLPGERNTAQARQYIIAVADKYWRTLDAVQAQAALSSYDPVELTALLAVILQESKSAETRTHVAALAHALDLMPPDSPFGALLAQPLFLLAFAASLLPFTIGVWLVILPAWRERKLEQARRAEQEVLGVSPPGGLGADETREAASQAEFAEFADEESARTFNPTTDARSAEDAQEGMVLPPLQPTLAEADLEEEGEEKAAEDKNILKDLASLFEEEDLSLSALEALVKNLPEVAIDELVTRTREVVKQLTSFITTRPSTRLQR